jgi:SHS2 domain-containing protein
MTEPRYEHFAHQADVGVRGHGPTLAAAFEQAALAVSALATDPAHVEPREVRELHCEAPNARLLLADLLNAVIFELSAQHRVFRRFEVLLDGRALRARGFGERFDPTRHAPGVEVKGATFTALEVRQGDGDWIAQCVVDV